MNKLTIIRLDETKITDKESFLKEIATVLELPDWFGYNWDALEDCLRELTENYCFLIESNKWDKAEEEDWWTGINILYEKGILVIPLTSSTIRLEEVESLLSLVGISGIDLNYY